MKIIYIVSILCFTASLGISQTKCDCYNRLKSLSFYYARQKDYNMASSALRDAISFIDEIHFNGFDFRYLAEYYYNISNYDSALLYSRFAVDNGVDSIEVKERFPNLFKDSTWNGFNIPKNRPDKHLESEFREREISDQLVRGILDPSEWLPDSLSKYENSIRILMYNRIDSINYFFIMKVIRKYGYPDYNKVGFNSIFKFMIMHQAANPGKIGDQIIFEIDSLVKSGDYIDKSDLLVFIDRHFLNSTGKTLAGTYGINRFKHLANLSFADSIRFKYNMLRIKEEGEGEFIPQDYHPIPYPDNYFCLRKYKIPKG